MADLLSPIYDGLWAELLRGHLIQSDDTTVPLSSYVAEEADSHGLPVDLSL